MKSRSIAISLSALMVSAAAGTFWACSEDTPATEGAEDGGKKKDASDDGEGGEGGEGGSSSGGEGGTGGSGGSGGKGGSGGSGGGAGGSGGGGGSGGADAGPAWCGATDGGVQSKCTKGQYQDTVRDGGGDAAGIPTSCKACPGRPITCADLHGDGGASPSYNSPFYIKGTKQLVTIVPAGVAEVVSGQVTVNHRLDCNGSSATSGSDAGAAVVKKLTVEGNTLRADLSSELTNSDDVPCGDIVYQLTDTCCTTSSITLTALYDSTQSARPIEKIDCK